jgi:hypothetical protein
MAHLGNKRHGLVSTLQSAASGGQYGSRVIGGTTLLLLALITALGTWFWRRSVRARTGRIRLADGEIEGSNHAAELEAPQQERGVRTNDNRSGLLWMMQRMSGPRT